MSAVPAGLAQREGAAQVDTRAPLLSLHVRAKRYGERTVLRGLRLALREGEAVALVGASGCGKSTLLRIAAGLDPQADATVLLSGRRITGPDPAVGMVFQEPRLFPWLSVAANVAFGAEALQPQDAARVAPLLAEVGLAGFGDALPKQLSGGQAQRVALARALLRRPRLLLLDEPFSAVDAFTRMRLQELLATLARRHGTTLLMVTHDVEEAVLLSDRVVVLDAAVQGVHAEQPVPLPWPRDRADPALAAARTALLHTLHAAHAF